MRLGYLFEIVHIGVHLQGMEIMKSYTEFLHEH